MSRQMPIACCRSSVPGLHRGTCKWALGIGSAALVVLAMLTMTITVKAKPEADEPKYLNPREMVLSNDGRWLYVMCEKRGTTCGLSTPRAARS